MAKFINNKIKSGRLAGSVFAVRNGVTIERAYQPFVANPSTEAQVETRAKFKLVSQLGTVLGGVIAFPRNGAVSPRNLFVKKNYPLATYSNGNANVNLTSIQLTESVVGFNAISATRSAADKVTVNLSGLEDFDKVSLIFVSKLPDDTLRLQKSVVEDTPTGSFSQEYVVGSSAMVVYAYGIRVNSERARAIFGNLIAPTAEQVAKIIVSRTISSEDVTLSETKASEVAAQA